MSEFDPAPVDLTAYDAEYESVNMADFDEVPDGKYQVRVDGVRLDHSQNGDPMLKWDLIVIAGQHAGRHIFKNSVITQASLPFVKGDMKTLGVSLAKFSDLPHQLESLLDIHLEVSKRTRGEYTNVYFNRRIQIPSGGQTTVPERDTPF